MPPRDKQPGFWELIILKRPLFPDFRSFPNRHVAEEMILAMQMLINLLKPTSNQRFSVQHEKKPKKHLILAALIPPHFDNIWGTKHMIYGLPSLLDLHLLMCAGV